MICLLSRVETAKLLGISPGTLDGMVKRGDGPPVARLGGRVLFPEYKLTEWIEAKTSQSVAA